MPWNIDLVTITRALIGDMDSSSYTDNRIRQMIVVAAYEVNRSIDFLKNYDVNISKNTISPDPVDEKDNSFSVLTAYKAAVLIIQSELKNQSFQSLRISDGVSSVDTSETTRVLQSLYKDLSSKYDGMIDSFVAEESSVHGQAVLSPYSPGSDLVNWYSHSDFRSNNL